MTTATQLLEAPKGTELDRSDGFNVLTFEESPGYNLPQRMGRLLWLPMFVMALVGWSIGIVLAVLEASTERSDINTLQDLSNLIPAFMFIGFLGVFAAITFAIVRILGAFRKGGSEVQQTAGASVQVLRMPTTAKLMLGLMMMGMMVMLAGITTNFLAAASFDATSVADIVDNASWGAAADGLRRLGVVLYLSGIAFGLGTIIEVLRFQSVRLSEVAVQHGHSHE